MRSVEYWGIILRVAYFYATYPLCSIPALIFITYHNINYLLSTRLKFDFYYEMKSSEKCYTDSEYIIKNVFCRSETYIGNKLKK